MLIASRESAVTARTQGVDWRAVVSRVAVSRALDDLEESILVPERKVLYQFSARGHDVTQALLGAHLGPAWQAAFHAFNRNESPLYGRTIPCHKKTHVSTGKPSIKRAPLRVILSSRRNSGP